VLETANVHHVAVVRIMCL